MPDLTFFQERSQPPISSETVGNYGWGVERHHCDSAPKNWQISVGRDRCRYFTQYQQHQMCQQLSAHHCS